jgi:hypothetical protein
MDTVAVTAPVPVTIAWNVENTAVFAAGLLAWVVVVLSALLAPNVKYFGFSPL